TGQNLIAATLLAGRIEPVLPQSAQAAFRQLEDMLQQSIREIRTVSYLLHPPLLDEAGLGLALRYFVEGFMKRSGIAVALQGSRDVDRLAPETELVLFRVVQEALTNISRHSKSPTARIHLAREDALHGQSVVLTIEDVGIGMPDARGIHGMIGRTRNPYPTRGVGLASMRERLHQIGGRAENKYSGGHTTDQAHVTI